MYVCIIRIGIFLDTTYCKLVIMADAVVIIVLAGVISKFVADVIAIEYVDLWQMESHSGRCCNHFIW